MTSYPGPRPEAPRCAVCGALAFYGIGRSGWPLAAPSAWYCAAHVPRLEPDDRMEADAPPPAPPPSPGRLL